MWDAHGFISFCVNMLLLFCSINWSKNRCELVESCEEGFLILQNHCFNFFYAWCNRNHGNFELDVIFWRNFEIWTCLMAQLNIVWFGMKRFNLHVFCESVLEKVMINIWKAYLPNKFWEIHFRCLVCDTKFNQSEWLLVKDLLIIIEILISILK